MKKKTIEQRMIEVALKNKDKVKINDYYLHNGTYNWIALEEKLKSVGCWSLVIN